jgi:two-component system, cell cycle sensor histidine kinase and response regulator CckA
MTQPLRALLAETVLDSLLSPVAVLDAAGTVAAVNDAWRRFAAENEGNRFCGCGVGSDYLAVCDPHPEAVAGIRRVLAGTLARLRVEYPCHSSARRRWFLLDVTPLQAQGQGAVIAHTDITARKQAEDALRHRLQLQVERMPLAYVLFDADFRVIDWNPTAARIFGYSKDEVLGLGPPFEKILPAALRPLAEGLLSRFRSGDMTAHSVNDNLTKDGRTITCEWFNTPLVGEDGGFGGLLCLAQDVPERKRLQEQLLQAQKMEAVGQLAGGVAHDFNNFLTIITGFSELVLGSLRLDDPAREPLEEIRKAGARSAALVRQLLAFSRKQVVAPTVLDLNEVVRDTETMLRRLLGEDIELVLGLDSALGHVKADPGHLEQVLLNLAVNARDAMPEGGQLTISTSNAGPQVLLTVADAGAGMTEEVKARIFEPFFTTKAKGKGTGLGLAVVHGVVQQSGGAHRS